MNEREVFHKNLEKLFERDPSLALTLEHEHPHPSSPVPNADDWFASLPLEGVDLLYLYGSSPEVYRAAQRWLREGEERYLVFLEDDLSALARFLYSWAASDLLDDPSADVVFFFDPTGKDTLFEKLSWKFAMGSFAFAALPRYESEKKEVSSRLEHRLRYDAEEKKALLDEYLHFGVPFFRNVYPNLLTLDQSRWGPALFGKAEGIPAIICGAGPSLEKQLPLLEALKDRALILAGGSSLNVLANHGILPHFGAGIDPNAEQEKRVAATAQHEIPFFYRLRMFHRALQSIKGPRFFIPGSGGYDIGEWVNATLELPEEEPVDEGLNVIHFCTDIARAMGCKQLIYIGMDLAFTGGDAYAPGVEASASSEEVIDWTDTEGQPIQTLWKWIAEAQWLGEYAQAHPDLMLINATEGGLGFPPVENRPLKEVVASLPSQDIQKKVAEWMENAPFPVAKADGRQLLLRLKKSLARCEQIFDGIVEEAEKIRAKIEKGAFSPLDLQTGRLALLETDLAEEEGYAAVLDLFALIIGQILQREQVRLQRRKLGEKEEHLGKLEISLKRFRFLREAAQIHQRLIGHTLEG